MPLVSPNDLLYEPMANNILFREVDKDDSRHLRENVPHFDQPGHAIRRKIDLRDVPGHDSF